MKSRIKIVKRSIDHTSTGGQDEFETKPGEPSTREITIVVKQWIAELKERKSSHNSNFTPLKVR